MRTGTATAARNIHNRLEGWDIPRWTSDHLPGSTHSACFSLSVTVFVIVDVEQEDPMPLQYCLEQGMSGRMMV